MDNLVEDVARVIWQNDLGDIPFEDMKKFSELVYASTLKQAHAAIEVIKQNQSAEVEKLREALSYTESMISKWVGDGSFEGAEADRAVHARDVARKALNGGAS
ncbi:MULTISPECIES: hypothetical protein [unclassified Thalassospira]|uniref:hypothetical protein n=1 Tax=unclassified Thalassospira TaxID=2648997 RepID=UPI0011813FE9|nr:MULTISPECIES: hypothetical protein [unclassified Thalassospira]